MASSLSFQCFTSADVFEDAKIEPNAEANAADIERIASVVISNILRGHCIGVSRLVSPDDFIRSVFEDYGTFGTILRPGRRRKKNKFEGVLYI